MHDPADNDLDLEQLAIPLESQEQFAPLAGRAGKDKDELNLPPLEAGNYGSSDGSLENNSNAESQSLKEAPPEQAGLDYGLLLQEKDSGGIEILVQMAQKGELDPKNIDIIDATDRFLRAIAAAPKENLRRSGKIIFHASVLLRMKAEALLITKIEDLDLGGDDFIDFDTEGSPIIYDSNDEAVGRQITLADLQRALVRRSKQRQSKQRRVTLEQLIESLREAERLEKKRLERQEREPRAVIQMDGYHDMQGMEDILELAHDEDIEDVIARIEQLLVKVLEDMMKLSLSRLIQMLDGKGDWVDAFLAVLFLSNAGKLNLEQEIFYGPLYLAKATAESLSATGTEGLTNMGTGNEEATAGQKRKSDKTVNIDSKRNRAAKQTKRQPRSAAFRNKEEIVSGPRAETEMDEGQFSQATADENDSHHLNIEEQ